MPIIEFSFKEESSYTLLIILIIILVIGLAVGGFFIFRYLRNKSANGISNNNETQYTELNQKGKVEVNS